MIIMILIGSILTIFLTLIFYFLLKFGTYEFTFEEMDTPDYFCATCAIFMYLISLSIPIVCFVCAYRIANP